MGKEFLTETHRSVTLNVTGGKIDSFREKKKRQALSAYMKTDASVLPGVSEYPTRTH